MALVASPPPEDVLTDAQQSRLDDLDGEIEKARSDLASLDQRNALLAASLLASDDIQQQLRQDHHFSEHGALLENRSQHCQTNVHRLALGVTTFPFIDPAPDTSDRPLLGIRFDIHRRGGAYGPAYYVFCKRSVDENQELSLFKHTLPAFIPIERFRALYLPLTDEGYGSEDSIQGHPNHQDLESFVSHVRGELVGWHLRQDAITDAQQKLGLSANSTASEEADGHDVNSFEPVATDANFIRVTWKDGRVGRLRLGNSLCIEKAVVFKQVNGEQQRDDESEVTILGQGAAIAGLPERLRQLYRKQHDLGT